MIDEAQFERERQRSALLLEIEIHLRHVLRRANGGVMPADDEIRQYGLMEIQAGHQTFKWKGKIILELSLWREIGYPQFYGIPESDESRWRRGRNAV